MFRRILIANRGEVAVRIARAARELGIAPVGVVSEADRDASWTQVFDQVVTLGPASARESYLDGARVLQAARQTHCTAVHPGWGFLAEDARFAAQARELGLTFVGPSADAIARMGQKSPAKEAMRSVGLPVVPGSVGLVKDIDAARAAAAESGYPLLLKADAGGGGRGMRRCDEASQLDEAFSAASAEAESAFANGDLYLERYLTGGRHIEVQLLCDRFGHGVHLFERECSIQRRHQKLIEEAPSPALDDAGRRDLGRRAIEAALALGYENAGTIEFLMDPTTKELFFMEMNTRLQVEHPVSELVCGVDIAAWQLRIAANHRLDLRQEDVAPKGHALECRINAEDPHADFRPTPGTLERFDFATDVGPGTVRVDTHLEAGDTVSPHYDSLLAKVIVHADTRAAAIATMVACLEKTRIEGVNTTIAVHLAVLASNEFRSGTYDTQSLPGWNG
ncbi:Biotin carboxylase [Planctomycetes bacterium Pla163]|uniref:Biotin carboxylase n=1 Tax=Rohdeia mirabilis TaxID=2528008 RepID=A0A518CXA6_9BACT|nr:Biotin carboxylase [Planctomycetes bacterium Pla163]